MRAHGPSEGLMRMSSFTRDAKEAVVAAGTNSASRGAERWACGSEDATHSCSRRGRRSCLGQVLQCCTPF
jgi:hypothetical protein